MEQFITGGSVAIKVNDSSGRYFQTKKGLRQGDPLSPILFNIVADVLTTMIERAKNAGQLNGIVPQLVQDGLSILQYADDIMLFMEHDLEKSKNLKLLLCAFEQLSGLKIYFHKSELFCFAEAQDIWLGNSPLCTQYPCLYNIDIAQNKQDTVANVFQSHPPYISFCWLRAR